MIRRPPRSTLFPTRRSSDLGTSGRTDHCPSIGTDRRPNAPITVRDRKSTRLNSSHVKISYAVFCLKKKIKQGETVHQQHRAHKAEQQTPHTSTKHTCSLPHA